MKVNNTNSYKFKCYNPVNVFCIYIMTSQKKLDFLIKVDINYFIKLMNFKIDLSSSACQYDAKNKKSQKLLYSKTKIYV